MSDQDNQPKRRGRPPKYAGEGKRQNFSFRIRSSVRDQLIAAVAESGRSLSEEIEHRLEQSFELPKLFDAMAEKAAERVTNAAWRAMRFESSIGSEARHALATRPETTAHEFSVKGEIKGSPITGAVPESGNRAGKAAVAKSEPPKASPLGSDAE